MKKLLALLGVITLASTLAACNIDNTDTTEELKEGTYLAVDINPSIEFIVDEDGIVESYNLVNEDAEIVAADLDFVGMTYEEALDAYLTAAEETGYIDANAEDNAVYITTSEEEPTDEEGTTEEPTEEEGTTEVPLNEDGTLREEVKDLVRNHFEERGIMGAAFDADLADEYGALAEEYDIGLGRVRLISRAVTLQEDLTFEEAVEMNMGEVMSILRDEHRNRMDEFKNEKREERAAFKNAMKEEMRGRGNTEGDTGDDSQQGNPFDGEVDWDQIEEQVRQNIENSRGNHENRMDDIKEKARGHMGGHGPFSGDDESTEEDTTPEEDTIPEEDTTPDEETDDSETTAFIA